MRGGVARDDATCLLQIEQGYQWAGKAHGLVGDDAPADAQYIETPEQNRVLV